MADPATSVLGDGGSAGGGAPRLLPGRVLRGRAWSVRVDTRAVVVTSVLAALLVAVSCWLLSVGDFPIPLGDVIRAIFGQASPDAEFIVGSLRLPRVVTGALVGAALGMSGAIFHSLADNPLAQPKVLSSAELNIEEIAALRPDVILGISSGMTGEEFAKLSQIAPTVAQPADYIDYGTPWDVMQQTIGDALGKPAEAAKVITDVKQLFTDARKDNPEFEGATAGVTFFYQDQPGGYASSDSRSRVLTDLGFKIPEKFDELAGDAFYFSVSQEQLSTLDTDVITWVSSTPAEVEAIKNIPLRPTLRAYKEGARSWPTLS